MKKILRLGTRGSPLALVQAQIVRDCIYKSREGLRDIYEIEIVPIRTSGDWRPSQGETTFLELGGSKGFFTKEIEEALLQKTIDCAVHSMKDVSVWDAPDLSFAAYIERADSRDALLSVVAPRLEDLPAGARIGTSSLRRKAQILALRPDLTVIPFRGNIDTRLKKLASEEADATILAVAGLGRLGMEDKIASILEPSQMLSAPAQGVLGVQIRSDNEELREWLAPLNHEPTMQCVMAERAFLRRLNGSCKTPIAALASIEEEGAIFFQGLVAGLDGTNLVRKEGYGSIDQPEQIGLQIAEEITREVPPEIFEG